MFIQKEGCGYYKMQKPYFDILVGKKLIVLQFDALEDEDEVKSEDAAAGGALIEAKLDKLSNTMQRVLVLVVALVGSLVASVQLIDVPTSK